MNSNQMSLLSAALQRAAATMRDRSGAGLTAPMPFGGPGMFNPTAMANQSQPGLQPTPNAQVASRFPDPTSANAQVANRFPAMDPAVLAKGDMLQPNANQYVAQNFPPAVASSGGGVPMPQPRPTQAPAAPAVAAAPSSPPVSPAMSFFQRNAAMMRDPVSGAFIDPTAAARAQAQMQPNPGIAQRVASLFGNDAATGVNGNGSIAGAAGPTSVGGAPLQSAPRPNGGLLSQMIWRLNGNR